MRQLPTGTVTTVFTDIEGSTRLLQQLGRDRYLEHLRLHRELLRDAFTAHGGVEVEMQGDSFHFSFARAGDAVKAAAKGQRALADTQWPHAEPIRVRIGVHTGEPAAADGLYVGLDIHRTARVMAAAHGGQVLLSETTAALVRDELQQGLALRDLGEHRLKDLLEPVRLYQLEIADVMNDFAPPRTLDNRRTNLPVQPTPLVGRERELIEVLELLRRDHVRLLTLTGPGGTGKTRLALQAAGEIADRFRDGVFLVALASISQPQLVVATIAQTLSVREVPAEGLLETLGTYLTDKQLLLLFDNFEHLLPSAPDLGELLARAPRVKMLTTTRERLRLSAEHVYDVPPLQLPATTAPERLIENEAVALFVVRAQAVKRDFALSAKNASEIAAVCSRLDGLPLAIELAAGRVAVMSPAAILRRLDTSLGILTAGVRDTAERQRTLRQTIDWSYNLLAPEEQALFARLSVFRGGCRLDAAEAVCGDTGALQTGLLDGLSSLVEKNLLRQREDTDGEPRFWMLETIREYARDRLAVLDETGIVQRCHGAWFAALASDAEKHLHGPDQAVWLSTLGGDLANLRAALDWLTDASEHEAALDLASALGAFWEIRGGWSEASSRLGDLLRLEARVSPARAKALLTAGRIELFRGNAGMARDVLAEAVDHCRVLGDKEILALSLAMCAFARAELGEYGGGKAAGEEGVKVARETRSTRVLAEALNDLAVADFYDPNGDHRRARAVSEEALTLWQRLGDVTNTLESLNNLGYIDLVEGRFTDARGFLEEAVELAQTVEDVRHFVMSRGNLALVSLFLGDYELAKSQLVENLRLCGEIGDHRNGREGLLAMAAVEAASGEYVRPARLFASVGVPTDSPKLPPAEAAIVERFLPKVRAALGEPSFSAVAEEARRLSFPETLVYAIENDLSGNARARASSPVESFA